MVDFASKKLKYEARWNGAKITSLQPYIKQAAEKIIRGKARYEAVAQKLKTEIPHITWWILGVIHYREANCDFSKYQHNGQLLGKTTTIVPVGKLFHKWEDSAIDASRMKLKDLDGTMAKTLFLLEGFNGYGYWSQGVASPYLWSGTNQYVRGKYIRDHVFSSSAVDKQVGIAAILKELQLRGMIG